MTRFRVRVFGKPGCDKCEVLNSRLDRILADSRWKDFDKEYCNLETVEGLVAFCEAECVNPQRVPAMLVMRWNEQAREYEPVPDPRPGEEDPVCKHARLYSSLGLQTDYSRSGGGVLTPRMIESVLQRAVA